MYFLSNTCPTKLQIVKLYTTDTHTYTNTPPTHTTFKILFLISNKFIERKRTKQVHKKWTRLKLYAIDMRTYTSTPPTHTTFKTFFLISNKFIERKRTKQVHRKWTRLKKKKTKTSKPSNTKINYVWQGTWRIQMGHI